MEYCECMKVLKGASAIRPIFDEIVEFVKDPSRDELSDITYGVGRFVGGIFGKLYVPMPYDQLHILKINLRMLDHGCIRSRRAVAAGDGCVPKKERPV